MNNEEQKTKGEKMNNEEKAKEDTVKEQKVCLQCGEPANITHCGVWEFAICDKCKIEMGEMVHNSIKQGTVLNIIKPRTKEDNVEEGGCEHESRRHIGISANGQRIPLHL